jgi:hypothetical protein
MSLDTSTFEYLKPTDEQMQQMASARRAFTECAERVGEVVPAGPDKTYLLRKLRECGMWANVAITREADGRPRE